MSINSFPHPRATLSHLVAHAGYFSGLPEPHWSLPSKNFPPPFPTEPSHPSEVGTQQGLLWHKVLANCLPDPSDWAGSDFGKSGKDYVLPKRRHEIWPSWSMLPKQIVLQGTIPWKNSFSFLQRKTSYPRGQTDEEPEHTCSPLIYKKIDPKELYDFFFSSKG